LPWWERFAWIKQHNADLTDLTRSIFWGLILAEYLMGEDSAKIDRYLSLLLDLERKDAVFHNTITGGERTEEAWELPKSSYELLKGYLVILSENQELVKWISEEITRLDALFDPEWERRKAQKAVLDEEGEKAGKDYRKKHPWVGLGDSFNAAALLGKKLSYNQYLVYKWHCEGLNG
jgi:hypothetical protein